MRKSFGNNLVRFQTTSVVEVVFLIETSAGQRCHNQNLNLHQHKKKRFIQKNLRISLVVRMKLCLPLLGGGGGTFFIPFIPASKRFERKAERGIKMYFTENGWFPQDSRTLCTRGYSFGSFWWRRKFAVFCWWRRWGDEVWPCVSIPMWFNQLENTKCTPETITHLNLHCCPGKIENLRSEEETNPKH